MTPLQLIIWLGAFGVAAGLAILLIGLAVIIVEKLIDELF